MRKKLLKRVKNLGKLFASLFAFALLSAACAHVRVPDTEWCGDEGKLGASCFHTLSDDERIVSKEVWDKERTGQVCTTSKDFAAWKNALLKLCDSSNRCDFDFPLTATSIFPK